MNLLDMMHHETQAQLEKIHVKSKETILHAHRDNYYVYFLMEGIAEAFLLNDKGDVTTVFLYHKDAVFGEIEQFYDGVKPVEITALSDCTLLRIHRHHFHAWLQSDFEATKALIALIAQKLVDNAKLIEAISTLTIQDRVVHCIARAHMRGDLHHLTKQHITKEVNTSLRSLNRILNVLYDANVIEYKNKTFRLMDEKYIQSIIQSFMI